MIRRTTARCVTASPRGTVPQRQRNASGVNDSYQWRVGWTDVYTGLLLRPTKEWTQRPTGWMAGPFDRIDAYIFTARRYAKRGICRRRVSVRPSVCLCVSVTLRYCTKMAKRRITQIMPHDRSGTLVFKWNVL